MMFGVILGILTIILCILILCSYKFSRDENEDVYEYKKRIEECYLNN